MDLSKPVTQVLDPLPAGPSEFLLCCHLNATSKIQIARITNIANWYFERVVFAGQYLMFEAPDSALLEIHSGTMASAIMTDRIPCTDLVVQEESREEPEVISRPEEEVFESAVSDHSPMG